MVMRPSFFTALLLVSPALAQQIKDGLPAFMSYPGISTACETALNTTVDCPAFLQPISVKNALLDSDQVAALCTTTCLSDLQSARSKITGQCTASTDVIVYRGIAYPATLIVDQYLFTYNVSCFKDSSSGQYCDPQFLNWTSQSALTGNQSCSPCWLGVQALQLGSPLGYDEDMASDFAELRSSCAVSGYSYATPTTYGLNATATGSEIPTFTPPSTCTGSYVLTSNDTCNSVAQAMGVSTYSLLNANGLDIHCQNFDAAVNSSMSLCTPPTCKVYTWSIFDSCNDVASQHGITVTQFLAWNPNFDSICSNGVQFGGYQVCVSTALHNTRSTDGKRIRSPGGAIDSGSSVNGSASGVATTAAPRPTNSFDETRECGNWYTVQSGDDCGVVSLAFAITLSDFLFLNPEIYANCTNLLLGVAYCVQPVGYISTYSGYSAAPTLPITVPPATFSSVNTAIPSSTSHPNPSYTSSQMPTASGTIPNCVSYVNYNSNTTIQDWNSCSFAVYAYGVAFTDLIAWNPSLSSDESSCEFQAGLSYCVRQTNASTYVSPDNGCLQVNKTEIVDGTDPACVCYTEVDGSDGGYGMGCDDVASDSSITIAQLQSFNPWLGSGSLDDCTTAMFANMDENDSRAICIGVNSTAPTNTATKPPSTVSTPTKTVSSASQGPTQSGVVAGCQKFYTVQSGDSCASIQGLYAITFAQLYSWNPSIGSNCQNLWLGYAYCVEGPASTTSGGGAMAPTQSGEAANCNHYYTVQSGDSCSAIETQFSITFQQLYQWNPAIGSNCESLWVGYAVCVGVSS